ncbi:MAG: hypothetical protein Q7P63_01295 [Verrucomicrobiota bacterium JB022]|nr:hypothetical protein [Verrucomicrobiota bacterium JB022]
MHSLIDSFPPLCPELHDVEPSTDWRRLQLTPADGLARDTTPEAPAPQALGERT